MAEIEVTGKMKFEKGNYEEAYNFLKSGWERTIEKIESHPQSNGLTKQLKERYHWINETDSTNIGDLLMLIDRIEYFIISM